MFAAAWLPGPVVVRRSTVLLCGNPDLCTCTRSVLHQWLRNLSRSQLPSPADAKLTLSNDGYGTAAMCQREYCLTARQGGLIFLRISYISRLIVASPRHSTEI